MKILEAESDFESYKNAYINRLKFDELEKLKELISKGDLIKK